MKKQLMYSASILLSTVFGAALAGPVSGPLPVGWFTCSNCHTEDPTLCISISCPPSANACLGSEGVNDDGSLWVSVGCTVRA